MFEKLDKIILNEGDMKKVNKYVQENKNKLELQLPMMEGVLIVNQYVDTKIKGIDFKGETSQAIHFLFSEDSRTLTIAAYDKIVGVNEDYDFNTKVNITANEDGTYKTEIVDTTIKNISMSEVEKAMLLSVTVILDVLFYMSNYKSNEVIEITEERSVRKKSGKGKKAKNRIVKITTKKYVFDKKYVPSGAKRVKRVFSWSVRGHWRHYKSGKTVWINPYTKGNKDAEKIEKEYRL